MSGILRRLIVAAILIGVSSAAFAQSFPSWLQYGAVGTTGQWQSAFQSKQDVLPFTPCNIAGCSMTGELFLSPSSVSRSGLNFGIGSAPASPSPGDLWATSGAFWFQGYASLSHTDTILRSPDFRHPPLQASRDRESTGHERHWQFYRHARRARPARSYSHLRTPPPTGGRALRQRPNDRLRTPLALRLTSPTSITFTNRHPELACHFPALHFSRSTAF